MIRQLQPSLPNRILEKQFESIERRAFQMSDRFFQILLASGIVGIKYISPHQMVKCRRYFKMQFAGQLLQIGVQDIIDDNELIPIEFPDIR